MQSKSITQIPAWAAGTEVLGIDGMFENPQTFDPVEARDRWINWWARRQMRVEP